MEFFADIYENRKFVYYCTYKKNIVSPVAYAYIYNTVFIVMFIC